MLPAKSHPELSLSERVRQALAQRDGITAPPPGSGAKASCLIVDVSGSMEEPCEPGRRKIDALRKLVADIGSDARTIYAFSDTVDLVTASTIPEPCGCTWMHRAFERAKCDGHTVAVLITDGLPRVDERIVIAAARGLRLEIFYVGPPPKPALLDRLAAVGKGQAHQADLRIKSQRQLQVRIRGLLGAG